MRENRQLRQKIPFVYFVFFVVTRIVVYSKVSA
jgi:hypothetical protein